MPEWRRPRTCGECAEYRDGACMQSLEEAEAADRACPLFEEREIDGGQENG